MNIPRNIPWNIPWNMKISKMEYSKINLQQGNIEIFGILNISGIFQKNTQKGENLKILEYGKFLEIFLGYFTKCKAGHGGVKIEQEKN